MESLAKYMVETVSSATLRRTVNRAYGALFEAGLSPQKKTRRAIRGMFPEPPGGWDSPAMDADGNQRFTAENGRPMTYAEALEYHIRNTFFHDGGRSNPRFEPGVARIAYKELGMWPDGLADWTTGQRPAAATGEIGKFAKVLREISDSHADDYDFDLNGMNWQEISVQFGHGSSGKKYVNEEADGTGCKYRVVWIKNFSEAEKYGKYTEDTQRWCLTEYPRYWKQYTKGNTVKMYFLMSPDVDTVEPEPGPNAPLDEYGLSLLGVGIAPDGTLDCCCTRWNHMHGGSDMALDEAQLCKLLNVRELSDVCPPYTDEDRVAMRDKFTELVNMAKAGKTPTGHPVELYASFGSIRVYDIPMGAGEFYKVVLKEDGTPAFSYPVYSCQVNGGYSMVAKYDPYFDDKESTGDDYAEEPQVIIRHDGEVHTTPIDEDVTCEDVLHNAKKRVGKAIMRDVRKGINRGRAYLESVPFGDAYMFDVTRMEYVGDEVTIEDVAGNLFMNNGELCVMAPEGPKVLTSVEQDQEYFFYGKGFVGCTVRDGDGGHSYALFDDITGELLEQTLMITDAEVIMDGQAVKIQYEDGDGELIGIYGKPLIEKGKLSDGRPKVLDMSDGKVKSFYGTMSTDGDVYTAIWHTGNDGIYTVKALTKFRIPLDRLPGKSIIRGIVKTDKGAGILVRSSKLSRAKYIAPDGTVYTGPYDNWGSDLVDGTTIVLERDSDASNALYGDRLVPVNFIDPKTGNPVFTPEFEKKMYRKLRQVLWMKTYGVLLLEFVDNNRKVHTYSYRIGGNMVEFPVDKFSEIENYRDYDHRWISPQLK